MAADRRVVVVSSPARRRGGTRPQRPLGQWPPRTSVGEAPGGGAGVKGEAAREGDRGGTRAEANSRVGGFGTARRPSGTPTPHRVAAPWAAGGAGGVDDALAVAAPPPQPPVRVGEWQGNKHEKTKGERGLGGGATTAARQRGVVVGGRAHTA